MPTKTHQEITFSVAHFVSAPAERCLEETSIEAKETYNTDKRDLYTGEQRKLCPGEFSEFVCVCVVPGCV